MTERDRRTTTFDRVEPGTEFWSEDGRVYVKGTPADPPNGGFTEAAHLGIVPSHVERGAAGTPDRDAGEFAWDPELEDGGPFVARRFQPGDAAQVAKRRGV